ncbi:MAG: DUF4910 domain-containing protein [Aquisalimonadaceae bacterium]
MTEGNDQVRQSPLAGPADALEPAAGEAMMTLIRRLYPICRSITGNGVRQSLDIIQELIPLRRHEIPTGTRIFDWEIPREWNIRDAGIRDMSGRRLVAFQNHTLHVLNYSVPVRKRISREELRGHLFTLPDHPDWIPYRTSYYKEDWGFCLAHNQLSRLTDAFYDIEIDSSLAHGSLTLAECVIPGQTEEEVLLSAHLCHPSLCNDNLSGLAVQAYLLRWLASEPRRYTYRAVFAPGTIGSLAWLWLNRKRLHAVRAGLVLTGVGDRGGFTYKRSRRGDAMIDRIVVRALQDEAGPSTVRDFSPYGYDERQYCSPGFDLPMGRLSRTPFGEYPEYHTSADDPDFVSAGQLQGALALCQRVVRYLEHNRIWRNLSPYGEPQLGKRGLYGAVGGAGGPDQQRMAMLWLLNLADGTRSLLDIADRAEIAMDVLMDAAERLERVGLLKNQSVQGSGLNVE